MVIVSCAGWLAWVSSGGGVSLVTGYVKDSSPAVQGTSTGQARLAAASGNGRIHRSEDARHGGPQSKLREQLRRISGSWWVAEPDPDGSDAYRALVDAFAPVIPGRHCAELLELAETAFDAAALFVTAGVGRLAGLS
jgi:hypothetical protein